MKTRMFVALVTGLLVTPALSPVRADGPKIDIKRAVSNDCFLAVDVRHNSQRDNLRPYYAEAWKTFQDEHICQRLGEMITSHVPADKLDAAKAKLDEFKTAVAPIPTQALLNADEIVFGEAMEGPVVQMIFAARLSNDDAANCERGAVQTFELLSHWSEGKITVEKSEVKKATFVRLALPKQSPFQPAVARLDNVVLFSTSAEMLHRSLELMQSAASQSKFDDPRLQIALAHLPKPDDALVFFDGQQLWRQFRQIGAFVLAASHNDEHAAAAAHLIERVADETAVIDYTVTVATTQDDACRQVQLVKMVDGYESTILGEALADAKPLEKWQTWIPRDATAYSFRTSANCHVLYQGIMKFLRENVPESSKALDHFAAIQEKIGVDIDHDILQSLGREHISVTVPITAEDGSSKQVTVRAQKCENPDKIRELLAHAVEHLNKIPFIQAQQLKLEDCPNLEGFQRVNAAFFTMIGIEPVIGFRDGWMMVSSNPKAVEKVLAVREGKAEALDTAAVFSKFGLDAKQPAYNVSYRDIGADIRHVASVLDKVGAMAPMFLSMAAAKAKPEEIKPAEEAIGLLPSIAKVIRKFDFFGDCLSVTTAGPLPNTYLKQSVTQLRPPKSS